MANLIGKISKSGGFIQVEVPVIFFEEDGVYFAHVPPLDISGYGYTETEAKKSLDVMLEEFFVYTTANKTLEGELKRLGWQKSNYPNLSDLISHNEQLKNIVNTKSIKTDRMSVNMPAFA